MNTISTSIVIIPGVVALLLCLLFSYLYQQSQQVYFRAWQIAWACYSIHYALDAFRYFRPPVGSSRVDLQACKLEYSIVSPK